MAKTSILGFSGLILLCLSILFLFFLILPGATGASPFDKTYFLHADTSGITGARDVSQWTYLYVCGPDNKDCTGAHAGISIGAAWDSGAANVPHGLGGSFAHHTTSHQFFYLWRFGWVFILMTLFFEVLALFSSLFACCGRIGSAIAFFVSAFALLCYSIAAALTTATFVKARNRFRDDHRGASLGPWGFGWLWGGYVALLVAVILFALGVRGTHAFKKGPRSGDGRRNKEEVS